VKPTVSQVYELARALLGDTEVPGGQLYTDQKLAPFFGGVYRKVFRAMSSASNPYVTDEGFYDLPANTGILDPATAGINNLDELLWIEERKPATGANVAVSAVTLADGVATVTTSTPHGRSVGDSVVAYNIGQVSENINGMWSLTAVSTTTKMTFGGSVITGTWTSGGNISYSDEQFRDMAPTTRQRFVATSQSGSPPISQFTWMGDVIQFHPSTETRQLRITYKRSGEPPTTPSSTVGIDDSIDVLATGLAGQAAKSFGNATEGNDLLASAFGPSGGRDGTIGGLLFELLQKSVKAMQSQVWRRRAFAEPLWDSD